MRYFYMAGNYKQQRERFVLAFSRRPQHAAALDYRTLALALLILAVAALPRVASAIPSFARQTGMPCSQCHTLSFGPALTAYGRQFKLNGYTFGEGEHPMPLAF